MARFAEEPTPEQCRDCANRPAYLRRGTDEWIARYRTAEVRALPLEEQAPLMRYRYRHDLWHWLRAHGHTWWPGHPNDRRTG